MLECKLSDIVFGISLGEGKYHGAKEPLKHYKLLFYTFGLLTTPCDCRCIRKRKGWLGEEQQEREVCDQDYEKSRDHQKQAR